LVEVLLGGVLYAGFDVWGAGFLLVAGAFAGWGDDGAGKGAEGQEGDQELMGEP
jgi:hypothetical protein